MFALLQEKRGIKTWSCACGGVLTAGLLPVGQGLPLQVCQGTGQSQWRNDNRHVKKRAGKMLDCLGLSNQKYFQDTQAGTLSQQTSG